MREKYIEEVSETIARSICPIYREDCDEYQPHTCTKCFIFSTPIGCLAEDLYNAGYRKQSEAEWISVEERLPDQYEDVLGFCHYVYESGGVCDLILTMKLTTDGKFVPFNCSPLKEGIVTHWMPLPEPPGMKGGSE